MIRDYVAIVVLFVGLISFSAYAKDRDLSDQQWHKTTAMASWLWMDIYEATLYQPKSQLESWQDLQQPLQLKLCYLLEIEKNDIIKAAEKVLPSFMPADLQAEVERLHSQYSDVKQGDCYTLKYQPASGVQAGMMQLDFNNQTVFTSFHAQMKSVYFGIWLGDEPLSESLRDSLLGKTL